MLSPKAFLAMRPSLRLATVATLAGLLFPQTTLSQTWSLCNPTTQSGCDPNPALGSSFSADLTSGASEQFTGTGNPSYDSDGVSLTVRQAGDAPTLASNWYIMFGRLEVTMKAATGAGIVSSVVLLSDDLDEIDWEWLGAQNDEVQSNYFGKGQTTTYDRAAVHAISDTQNSFHTYTIDWTESRIVWQINGETVRVLEADAAQGQYPQTPCQVRVGAWSGGDPNNAEGTIAWAQGPTDFSAGPFTMVVSSIAVTDYSTGSQYTYGDQSGDWTSIESTGGRVNGNAGGSNIDSNAPAITSTSSGNQPGWAGGLPSTFSSAVVTNTDYPGLPSGWVVTSDGKVRPPSAAPVSKHHIPSPLSAHAPGSRVIC